MHDDDQSIFDATAHVRGYTGSTALTAALLILFGFFYFSADFARDDTTTSAVIVAYQIFVNTLRIGGVLLAVTTVFLSVGFPLALLGDAIVTAAVGALLVVSCVLFIMDDGFDLSYLIYGICGLSLLTSGFRCWSDYGALPADIMVDNIEDIDLYNHDDESEIANPKRHQDARECVRSNDEATCNEPIHFDKPVARKHQTKGSRFEPEDSIHLDSLSPDDTPPDGFLADFGKGD